ncbi:MAG TPA: putative Ig domain-containing protein, partial [Terriglobales bacterium]|nr:putative Ig domain-containing protein [Terriglobales bacterium]
MWRLIFVLLFAIGAVAQTANTPQLTFITKTLPGAMVGHSYTQQIQIQGGKGPFKWSIGEGYLPPGVDLQTNTGLLSGQPSVKGYFRFVVEVQDLATHATAKSEFAINVSGPLLLEWVDPPKLSDNTISGRIKVTNSSTQGDSFDLTVIVVAVNEVGKAFALGYQH